MASVVPPSVIRKTLIFSLSKIMRDGVIHDILPLIDFYYNIYKEKYHLNLLCDRFYL